MNHYRFDRYENAIGALRKLIPEIKSPDKRFFRINELNFYPLWIIL